MSSARKVLSNTAAQVVGKVVTAIISIVIIKLITTYLGLAGYGQYTTVYEFLAFFGIAADFGIFQIAVREMSRDPSRREEIFGNVLSLRLCLTAVSMLAAAGAVWLIPKYTDTQIPLGVVIGTLTTYLTLVHGTLSSALQASHRIGQSVIAQIAGKIVALGYMLWAVFVAFPDDPTMGFYHLLIAGIAGNAVMTGLTLFFTQKIIPTRLRWDLQVWREVMAKALPYGTAIVLATVYFRIDTILLSLLKGPEEVGVYGVAMRILENLQMIPVFFMNAVLPVMTPLIGTDNAKFKRVLQHSFDFLVIVGAPMVVGGFVLAYPFIAIVSDPEFLSNLPEGFFGADIALQILLFAMGLAFLGNLFNYTLFSAGAQKKVLVIAAVATIFNLGSNLLVIPEWGFRGAAATSVASELIVAVGGFLIVRKMTQASLNFKRSIRVVIAAVVMGAAVAWLQPLTFEFFENKNVLLLIPAGAVVYTALLFILKVIDRELIDLVRKKV